MYKLYKECWVDNQPPHKSEQLTRTQCKQLLNGGVKWCVVFRILIS